MLQWIFILTVAAGPGQVPTSVRFALPTRSQCEQVRAQMVLEAHPYATGSDCFAEKSSPKRK